MEQCLRCGEKAVTDVSSVAFACLFCGQITVIKEENPSDDPIPATNKKGPEEPSLRWITALCRVSSRISVTQP